MVYRMETVMRLVWHLCPRTLPFHTHSSPCQRAPSPLPTVVPALRGGVPICFPQFGMMGPMPSQHGFVRNVAFELESFMGHTATLVCGGDGLFAVGLSGWDNIGGRLRWGQS